MAKPSSRPAVNNIALPSETVHFDIDAFDILLRGNGVVFEHYRSLMCPIGFEDRFDTRSHIEHSCSNGFEYDYAGTITAFFSGNTADPVFEEAGILDGSTVQITLPRFYDCTEEPVSVGDYDRFYLKDLKGFSIRKQRFEAHQSGIDKLEFMATAVEALVDSRGTRYQQDVDFAVTSDGNIQWLPEGKRPGYDPVAGKGVICSIRYRYVPHFYVKRLLHEVRVCRVENPLTGEVALERMPFAVLLQREVQFRNQTQYKDGESAPRDIPHPRQGGFGPR